MAAEWTVPEQIDEPEVLRRRRRHQRLVKIGDAADTAVQWAVTVVGIAVAAVIIGAALLTAGLALITVELALLDLIGRWLR